MRLHFIFLPVFDAALARVFRTTREADEYMAILQRELQSDPERGDLMPRTGGARKIRVAMPGRGKRGGARVVYVYFFTAGVIVFLAVYQKNEQANLSPEGEAVLRSLIEQLREEAEQWTSR